MKPTVDQYLERGCMRCKYGNTPQCKVNWWRTELLALRALMLRSGLTECIKWGVPVYTHAGKNVVMVHALKDFAFINFFKGALLADPHRVLLQVGNQQSDRSIRFTHPDQIEPVAEVISQYVREAIELENQGKKIVFQKNPEPIPDELLAAFDADPASREHFLALTPGRQRGYIIYFSQPKQSETRVKRIQASKAAIAEGIGMNDKYRMQPKKK